MEKKKIIQYVESFILLPMLTISMPMGGMPSSNIGDIVPTSHFVLSEQKNIEADGLVAFNQALDQKAKTLKIQADAIDAYFAKYNMPLKGTGMKMAIEAEANGLDYRLLPAIAVRESTGGKHACQRVKNSFFGWGSCKIGFESKEKAIEIVAWNLGGKNPNTDHHYEGKSTVEILNKYNPPSIIPKYTSQVVKIMNDIGDENLGLITVEL